MRGTYILFLESKKDIEAEVGKLGKIKIDKGLYAYVGSAMGRAVNLENRIKRHELMAKSKKGNRKWHIDYFTTAPGVELSGVVRIIGKGIECRVADLMKKNGGKILVKGFGSSDCKCKTHFFGITQEVAKSFLHGLPDTF